jgi:hypothetical protein
MKEQSIFSPGKFFSPLFLEPLKGFDQLIRFWSWLFLCFGDPS